MKKDRDVLALAAMAVLLGLALLPPWLRGQTPFWGDLTYIHHPWRALDAQVIQAGRLPLWNPYLYFGMPMLASMQGSALYPGQPPFFLLRFTDALALFHLIHYWLAWAWTFLWLKSRGLRVVAALAGAALLALGGVWLRERPFLNHLAALAYLPALLLFCRCPRLLAVAAACAFLAGYPPYFLGALATAFLVSVMLDGQGARLRAWASAGARCAGLAGCLLLPAVELVRLSRRSSGVPIEEALQFGFSPGDLAQWVGPWLSEGFDPARRWWTSCFIGVSGCAAAAAGWWRLPWRGRALLACWLAAAAVLILGASNPVSRALWEALPPLAYIRYPGFLSYAAVPVLCYLAAFGLERSPAALRRGLAAVILIELFCYGWAAFPLAGSGLFTSAGPLVRRLQRELEEHRYLLSPRALEASSGAGVSDWKHRLYGLTNAPFRLRAAGNFGEPLVPQACYSFMDRLYSAKGAEEAAALFPWADIRFLLTPQPLALGAKSALSREGRELWEIYRLRAPPSGAFLISAEEGNRLPAEAPAAGVALPRPGLPLKVERRREDRFSVAGSSPDPGWAYVSEPLYPGWRVTMETERGSGAAAALPALGAFQKVHVPAGSWRLDFRYEPESWRWGLILTVVTALLMSLNAWRWIVKGP